MQELLLKIKQETEDCLEILDLYQFQDFTDRDEAILRQGEKGNPLPRDSLCSRPKRGRKARNKARNLLDRLRCHQAEVLRFIEDPEVPFDNNLAERDLRMSKAQRKVPGGFRTEAGSLAFNRIRSYLSTTIKQGRSVLESI